MLLGTWGFKSEELRLSFFSLFPAELCRPHVCLCLCVHACHFHCSPDLSVLSACEIPHNCKAPNARHGQRCNMQLCALGSSSGTARHQPYQCHLGLLPWAPFLSVLLLSLGLLNTPTHPHIRTCSSGEVVEIAPRGAPLCRRHQGVSFTVKARS